MLTYALVDKPKEKEFINNWNSKNETGDRKRWTMGKEHDIAKNPHKDKNVYMLI